MRRIGLETGTSYYLNHEGRVLGPLSLSRVRDDILAGKIGDSWLLQERGASHWTRAIDLPELSDLFEVPERCISETIPATPRSKRFRSQLS